MRSENSYFGTKIYSTGNAGKQVTNQKNITIVECMDTKYIVQG